MRSSSVRGLFGALLAVLLAALGGVLAQSCSSDGATPNCQPDGGDCLTLPMMPNPQPTSDAGSD